MDTQFKKGVLEMCVLFQLLNKDMYGYEIMKVIKEVFPDVYDGSIYTILRRLNKENLTESYMGDVPSGGPQRKYYQITPLGKKYYSDINSEWKEIVKKVEKLGL